MKIGTLIIKTKESDIKPDNCIEANGQWLTKDQYPCLHEIFKDCKCHDPIASSLTGISEESVRENGICMTKGVFHLPNSFGKAWIVCDANPKK